MFDIHSEEMVRWLGRILGAVVGVLASMIIIAPEGTRNALYRLWVGVTMGVIFAPLLKSISFISGDEFDLILVRSAVMGFVIWSVLEATARFLSQKDWLVKLAQEILRLNSKEKEK